MITQKQLTELDASWEIGVGFLGKLRDGRFDDKLYENFMRLLENINFEGDTVPKRAVSLLWYIPLFMEWQKERLTSRPTNEYNKIKTKIESELERILGVP